MAPELTTTSPVALSSRLLSVMTLCDQRIFSPPSPPMSFSARSSLTEHIITSCASRSFFATALLKFFCSDAFASAS